MKKTTLALIMVLVLSVSLFLELESAKIVKADPFSIPGSHVGIKYPKNATYNSNPLMVYYSATFVLVKTELVTYSLDGKANITILDKSMSNDEWLDDILGNLTLYGLSEGSHHLEFYSFSMGLSSGIFFSGYAEVYFSIDTFAPSVAFLTVENKTYITPEIPLNFLVSEATSWLGYSLDNQTAIKIGGNTTLRDLSQGSHSLVVYANDNAGNMGASETVFFTVEPFPTTLIIASVSIVAVVCMALSVYIKKFYRNKSP